MANGDFEELEDCPKPKMTKMEIDSTKELVARMKASSKNNMEVGAKYKMYFGHDNLNNKNIEIRAIVDDEYVVFKSWSKNKSRYVYSIESLYYFRLLSDQGSLKQEVS